MSVLPQYTNSASAASTKSHRIRAESGEWDLRRFAMGNLLISLLILRPTIISQVSPTGEKKVQSPAVFLAAPLRTQAVFVNLLTIPGNSAEKRRKTVEFTDCKVRWSCYNINCLTLHRQLLPIMWKRISGTECDRYRTWEEKI